MAPSRGTLRLRQRVVDLLGTTLANHDTDEVSLALDLAAKTTDACQSTGRRYVIRPTLE